MAGSIGLHALQTWERIMDMVAQLVTLEPHSEFEKLVFPQIRNLAQAFKTDQGLQDLFCKIVEQLALGQERLNCILQMTTPSPAEYLGLLSVTEMVHLSSEAGQQRENVFRSVAEKIQVQAAFLKLLKESDPLDLNKFFPKESNFLGSLLIKMIPIIAAELNNKPCKPPKILETLSGILESGNVADYLCLIANEGCKRTLESLINHFEAHWNTESQSIITGQLTREHEPSTLLAQVAVAYQAHRQALLTDVPWIEFLRKILQNSEFKSFDSFLKQASADLLRAITSRQEAAAIPSDWVKEDELARSQLAVGRAAVDTFQSEREQLLGYQSKSKFVSHHSSAAVVSQFDAGAASARRVLAKNSQFVDVKSLPDIGGDDKDFRKTPELC